MREIGTLHPRPPYNLSILLDILSRFASQTLDIARDGAYWRVLRGTGDGAVLLRVLQTGMPEQPTLTVDLVEERGAHGLSDSVILARLAHILDTDADNRAFYALADAHPPLAALIAPLRGVPAWRTDSLYEALVMTIIEQQIAWKAALKAQRWLMEWGGLEINGVYAFPTPVQLASATEEDLKPTRITFKRMRLLINLAGQLASGALDERDLAQLPPQAAYDALIRIKGIGHWTASVVLDRAYGYHAWVAYNDVALQSASNRYWLGGRGRISDEQMLAVYTPFGVYAGTAAYYTLLRWVLDEYPQIESA